jgi:hypothetical protein
MFVRPLFASLVLAVALLTTACATGGAPYQPGDPRLQNARLEIVGPSTFNLMYSQTVDLRVRYVFEQVPAPAPPPEGTSVSFAVAVSMSPAGSIRIDLRYAGDQRFDQFVPYLFSGGVTCDAASGGRPPAMADRVGPVGSSLSSPLGWAGVPPASGYTVMVVGEIAGAPAAFGCRVGVDVRMYEETRVQVDLIDIEQTMRFEGTYDLRNAFDFGDGLPGSVDTALEVLHELADDENINGSAATDDWGQDPGAFITDLVMRLTCAWDCTGVGGSYSACGGYDHTSMFHGWGDLRQLYQENFTSWSGAESSITFGCAVWEDAGLTAQNFINTQIGRFVPEIVLRFLDSASDLAGAIVNSQIQSVLILSPMDEFGDIPFDHRLVLMQVSLRDLGGSRHFIEFNLRDAGVAEVSRMGLARAGGDTLSIPAHSFDIHLGRLVQYIYLEHLLPLFGFDSTADMFREWIDCAAVGAAVYDVADSITTAISAADYERYCDMGLEAAGGYVDDNIAGLIDVATTLTIQGTAVGAQPTTAGIAQELQDGVWMGSWDESGMGDSISGTFTGMLRAP